MPRKPRAIVLDSWSVMAYLEDEPAGQKVAEVIANAHEKGVALLMTVVNAGEVWYIIARELSAADADDGIAALSHLGIEFVDVDWALTREAGSLKARHRMSYADCFAAALAKAENAELLTGDDEFKQVVKEVLVRFI